jgi:predicted Na+-dependent transporter
MLFGISLTPAGWFVAFVIALFAIFTPIWIIGAIANQFPEPYNSAIQVIGVYLLMPILLTYLYKSKFYKYNRGSVIYWIYTGMYTLFFIVFLSHLFSKPLSFETIIAPIVTGLVSGYMIYTSFKIKKQYQKDLQKAYEAQREGDIKKQAEAIILAEKMKENGKTN